MLVFLGLMAQFLAFLASMIPWMGYGISMGYLKIQNTNPSKNPCWQAEESSNPMLAWMLRHIYFDQFLWQNGKPKWQQDIPFLG
jgi:hypothetical protein